MNYVLCAEQETGTVQQSTGWDCAQQHRIFGVTGVRADKQRSSPATCDFVLEFILPEQHYYFVLCVWLCVCERRLLGLSNCSLSGGIPETLWNLELMRCVAWFSNCQCVCFGSVVQLDWFHVVIVVAILFVWVSYYLCLQILSIEWQPVHWHITPWNSIPIQFKVRKE